MSKVKFGLSNVHISLRTETDGTVTYATPIALPGAVSMTLQRNVNSDPHYADNIPYFTTNTKGAITGELEVMDVPRDIALKILGYVEDANGGAIETSKAVTPAFALLFQVETDVKARKIAYYNVTAVEGDTEYNTVEDSVEPTTTTLSFTVTGEMADGVAYYSKTVESTDAGYDTFFTTVALPEEKTETA